MKLCRQVVWLFCVVLYFYGVGLAASFGYDEEYDETEITLENSYEIYDDDASYSNENENVTEFVKPATESEINLLREKIAEYVNKNEDLDQKLDSINEEAIDFAIKCIETIAELANLTVHAEHQLNQARKSEIELFMEITRLYTEGDAVNTTLSEAIARAERNSLKNRILQEDVSLLISRKENGTADLCHKFVKNLNNVTDFSVRSNLNFRENANRYTIQWISKELEYEENRMKHLEKQIASVQNTIIEKMKWCEKRVELYNREFEEKQDDLEILKQKMANWMEERDEVKKTIDELKTELESVEKKNTLLEESNESLYASLESFSEDIRCYSNLVNLMET